ncbi:hypothetical protein K435DRAFT_860275 [Dendrothele bispora CBS 962.96]|uniref:BTB domain-containing protein n=1 Tax=Dendrothele bispora (strain CBS 962.96) TaxID=1314807 RepID=A0A4V4HFF4_DENBC|nr:hypothetical protein K435DRAFT_860275 [Dendrothele bispora CBS 962.96]
MSINTEAAFKCHDKFFFFVTNVLFNLDEFLITPRVLPLQDCLSIPVPEASHEGSVDWPIFIDGVALEDFEAYIDLIYNLDQVLTQEEKPFTYYLSILHLATMWMWDAGVRFSVAAIDAIKPSDFDPYLKLIIGITYQQEA